MFTVAIAWRTSVCESVGEDNENRQRCIDADKSATSRVSDIEGLEVYLRFLATMTSGWTHKRLF